jgi:hypothetical protein
MQGRMQREMTWRQRLVGSDARLAVKRTVFGVSFIKLQIGWRQRTTGDTQYAVPLCSTNTGISTCQDTLALRNDERDNGLALSSVHYAPVARRMRDAQKRICAVTSRGYK